MLDKISGRIFVRVIQCDADIDNPHTVLDEWQWQGGAQELCLLSVKDHNTEGGKALSLLNNFSLCSIQISI